MLLEIYFEPQGIDQCLVYLNDLRVSGTKYREKRQPYLFQLDVPHGYLDNLKGIMIQNHVEHECLKVSFLAQLNPNSPLTLIGSKDVTYQNLENRPSTPNDGFMASLNIARRGLTQLDKDDQTVIFQDLFRQATYQFVPINQSLETVVKQQKKKRLTQLTLPQLGVS